MPGGIASPDTGVKPDINASNLPKPEAVGGAQKQILPVDKEQFVKMFGEKNATSGVSLPANPSESSGDDVKTKASEGGVDETANSARLGKEPTHEEVQLAAYLDWANDGKPEGNNGTNYYYNAQNRLRTLLNAKLETKKKGPKAKNGAGNKTEAKPAPAEKDTADSTPEAVTVANSPDMSPEAQMERYNAAIAEKNANQDKSKTEKPASSASKDTPATTEHPAAPVEPPAIVPEPTPAPAATLAENTDDFVNSENETSEIKPAKETFEDLEKQLAEQLKDVPPEGVNKITQKFYLDRLKGYEVEPGGILGGVILDGNFVKNERGERIKTINPFLLSEREAETNKFLKEELRRKLGGKPAENSTTMAADLKTAPKPAEKKSLLDRFFRKTSKATAPTNTATKQPELLENRDYEPAWPEGHNPMRTFGPPAEAPKSADGAPAVVNSVESTITAPADTPAENLQPETERVFEPADPNIWRGLIPDGAIPGADIDHNVIQKMEFSAAKPAPEAKKNFMQRAREKISSRLKLFRETVRNGIENQEEKGSERLRQFQENADRLDAEAMIGLEEIAKDVGGKVADASGKLAKKIGTGSMSALKLGVDVATEGAGLVATGVAGTLDLPQAGVAKIVEGIDRGRYHAELNAAERALDKRDRIGDKDEVDLLETARESVKRSKELKKIADGHKAKMEKYRIFKRGLNALFKPKTVNPEYKTPFNT